MLPAFPASYATDGDGFAPPNFGGDEAIKYFPFTYQTPAETRAMTIPAGATITGMGITVDDTFNNTPTLSVGDDASATSYLNAASVLGTAGPVYSTSWVTKNKWFSRLTSLVNLNLTIGGTPDQGSGYFWVRYVLK